LADDLNDQVTGFETQQETTVQANTQSQMAADGGNVSSESRCEEESN
jgi:methyl-accepting chemotaxis protein